MTTYDKRLSRLLITLSLALALIALRCGHLATWGHQALSERASREKARVHTLPAARGEILDRYGIPLATNEKAFRAGVLYSELSALAKTQVIDGERVPLRAAYIEKLSQFIARELGTDPATIEDAIYASAAQCPTKPYLFPQCLTEKQFARLAIRTHTYPGLVACEISKRHYPHGNVGAHVIGYTAPLGREGWQNYLFELTQLKKIEEMHRLGLDVELPPGHSSIESVEERLTSLREKFHTLDSHVGSSGLEKQWDEALRGSPGKAIVHVDATGKPLEEPKIERSPKAGALIQVSLSIELQKICEELLIDHERRRRGASSAQEPWIKGGAIVALEAKTGDVIALASVPRFNPNDLTEGDPKELRRWLESNAYLADLWDRREPWQREVSHSQEESLFLSWGFYLHLILPESHPVRRLLSCDCDITSLAKKLQRNEVPKELATTYDQNLFIDLANLAIDKSRFTPNLIAHFPKRTIDEHFKDKGHFQRIEAFVRSECSAIFRETVFANFRANSAKAFLKEMRKKERENKTFARPYTTYLRAKEQELFNEFWQKERLIICRQFLRQENQSSPYMARLAKWASEVQNGAHGELDWASSYRALSPMLLTLDEKTAEEYLATLTGFREIADRELLGTYPSLRTQTLGGLALAFYPKYGLSYLQSRAFQLPSTPGSLFKLVPAYAALMHNYATGNPLNPLTMIDVWQHKKGRISGVGKKLSGTPYPRWYRGGRLPKSAMSSIGKIDLKRALATTSNPYFSILCVDVIPSVDELIEKTRFLGFGEPTGIDLPFESSGQIPCDLSINRSGLYAFAIGQHTTTATPLQIAQMLRLLTTHQAIGPPRLHLSLPLEKRTHSALLEIAGIEGALFEASVIGEEQSPLKGPLPKPVQDELIEGMRQVVQSPEGTAHPSHIRLLPYNHPARQSYLHNYSSIIGKTSTAEVIETHSLDQKLRSVVYKNTWFGGVSYFEGEPELVVVVFLPHGTGGKEGAPLMARVVEAYRDLENRKATRAL